jgi:Plavaka transposase
VTPIVRICPDGHFRRVIYDMIAFIADYPEQVLLTNIVQDWCPRCTAMSDNLDVQATPRTSALTEGLINILDSRTLWVEYGINKDIIVRSRASI